VDPVIGPPPNLVQAQRERRARRWHRDAEGLQPGRPCMATFEAWMPAECWIGPVRNEDPR